MQINLSTHTRIKVDAIDNQIHLTLYDIMSGTIQLKEFKDLIENKLKIPESYIQISKLDNDLIVDIEDIPNLPSSNRIIQDISSILSYNLPATLKNKITKRNLIYITKDSGIPLMGSIYFGIIDRGTNLLQVRPMTGCLLNCPFCSVDEGPQSKTKYSDYIVDYPYLIEETTKVIDYKGISDIEIHIDGQSEPTLYPHLLQLIGEFKKDPRIAIISMQTNGMPLTQNFIRNLEKSGLSRINLSINSLNLNKSQYLAGTSKYNLNQIKQITKIIAKSSINLLISPVWIPGLNDEDIEEIISFVSDLNLKSNFPVLGIQNYLKYKFGRKMKHVKMVNKRKFKEKLEYWEEKFEISPLFLSPADFGTHPARKFPNIFNKGEIIELDFILPGRILSKNIKKREMLGSAKNRIIQVMNSIREVGERIPIKIIKTKDNIYYGQELK